MRVSLVDHIDRTDKCLLRDRSGTLTGWVLDEREGEVSTKGDVLLNYTPKVLFVQFEGATWQIDGLDPGTYPLTPVGKYWSVDPQGTALKVKRTQQPVAPDYARTAYTAQGMTLPAAIVDLCFDDNMDPATAYVALSRVKTADDILIMQAFSITPFTQGSPLGPRLLTKKLRGEDIKSDVEEFLAQEAEQRKAEALRKAVETEKQEETKESREERADTRAQQLTSLISNGRLKDSRTLTKLKSKKLRGKLGNRADRKGQDKNRRAEEKTQAISSREEAQATELWQLLGTRNRERGVLVKHLPAEALERSRYPERGARAYLGKLFMPTLPRNALRNAMAAQAFFSFSPNGTDFGLPPRASFQSPHLTENTCHENLTSI